MVVEEFPSLVEGEMEAGAVEEAEVAPEEGEAAMAAEGDVEEAEVALRFATSHSVATCCMLCAVLVYGGDRPCSVCVTACVLFHIPSLPSLTYFSVLFISP